MTARRVFKFRLYVADHAVNSSQAVTNLKALCSRYLADRHEIEIVDVYRYPKRALAERIVMTPTLDQLAPFPVRIVGSLAETELVLTALGLEPAAA